MTQHSIREIFYRADEMFGHPLRWPWRHSFTQSSLRQRMLWIGYRGRCWLFPGDVLTKKRGGW